MTTVLERPELEETIVLERELNELMETTFRMEHELELLFHKAGSSQ